MKKRFWSIVLAATLTLSLVPTAAAANYTTDYNSFSTPSSSDYAYWSGSNVVRNSGTTISEVKWMQAALNYCIANKGLNASYLDVDGSFGPASKSTTKAFQSKYGLSVDGSFGPATIAKMKEVLTPAPAPAPTPAKPKSVSVSNGWYTFTPQCASGYRLDVNGGTNGDGVNIQIWEANQTNAQKFYVRSIGGGYYTISTYHDGMVLDVNKGRTSNGTNVHQWHATSNNEAQQWTFQDAGNGYVWIVPRVSGSMRLDVNNADAYNGVNVHIWGANDTNAQKWKLTSTSAPETAPQPDVSQPTNTTPQEDHTTDYGRFSTPDSSDYAYWDGSEVVRSSGTSTSEVKWMQAALNYCIANKGLDASYLDVDGSFGPASETAAKAFQRKYSLSADGAFGPDTIQKMKEVLGLVQPQPPAPTVIPDPPKPDDNTSNITRSGTAEAVINLARDQAKLKRKRVDYGFPMKSKTEAWDWCGYFVSKMGRDAGANFPSLNDGGNVKSACIWFANKNAGTIYYFEDSTLDSLRNGRYASLTSTGLSNCVKVDRNTFEPRMGDLFAVHKHRDKFGFDHIGFVIDYSNTYIQTVEGNTGSLNANNSIVAEDSRPFLDENSRGHTIQVIVRPNYTDAAPTVITPEPAEEVQPASYDTDYNRYTAPGSSDYAYWSGNRSSLASRTTIQEVKWMQAALNYCIQNKGLNTSGLDVDGSFGPASQTATQVFQSAYGLSADGSFGPSTIAKMKSVLGLAPDPVPTQPSSSGSGSIPYNAAVPVDPQHTNSAGSRSAAAYNQVIDQFEVGKNSRYTPFKRNVGDTYCNIFAWDVSVAMNAEIPHWVTWSDGKTPKNNNTGNRELDANATYDWLKDYGSDYGWYTVSAEEAQNRANSGYPTVGIKRSGIGHVVVVRPETEKLAFSNRGPVIAQAGGTNFNCGYIRDSYKNYTFYTHD